MRQASGRAPGGLRAPSSPHPVPLDMPGLRSGLCRSPWSGVLTMPHAWWVRRGGRHPGALARMPLRASEQMCADGALCACACAGRGALCALPSQAPAARLMCTGLFEAQLLASCEQQRAAGAGGGGWMVFAVASPEPAPERASGSSRGGRTHRLACRATWEGWLRRAVLTCAECRLPPAAWPAEVKQTLPPGR